MALKQSGTERVIDTAGLGSGVSSPDLIQLNDGRLVMVWAEVTGQPTDQFTDTDGAIFGQILSQRGEAQGDIFQINSFEPFEQGSPVAVPLSLGGFAVAWQRNAVFGETTTDPDPVLQFFDADGERRSLSPIDVLPDSPPAPEVELDNLFVLSSDRVGVVLDTGVIAVYNATGGLLFFVSSGISVLDEASGGKTDVVQFSNGNIVKANPVPNVDPGAPQGAEIVRLFLTDTAFEAPSGVPGVSAAVPFDIRGNENRDKEDVNVDELAGGGLVLSFAEARTDDTSRIRMQTTSEIGQPWDAIQPIDLPFGIDDRRADHDMVALEGGGVALAFTDAQSDLRLNLYNPDGTQESSILVAGGRGGAQVAPQLAELEDGRLAVTFIDESRSALAGGDSPLRLAFYDVDAPAGRFDGSDGNDRLTGVEGREVLLGLQGDDTIKGAGGNDTLGGGDGDDVLRGGNGSDALRGDDGNDRLDGGKGRDGLGGNAGRDRLEGGEGDDILGGGAGNDRVSGGDGRDKVKGGAGNDVLDGGAGDDLLRGGEDDDALSGGAGVDRLIGDLGDDTLEGGGGEDVFIYRRGDAGTDRILDFEVGTDTLLLSGIAEDAVDRSSSGGDTIFRYGDTEIVVVDVDLSVGDLTFD